MINLDMRRNELGGVSQSHTDPLEVFTSLVRFPEKSGWVANGVLTRGDVDRFEPTWVQDRGVKLRGEYTDVETDRDVEGNLT